MTTPALAPPPPAAVPRPYRSPRILEFGLVAQRTLGGSQPMMENMAMPMSRP